MSERVLFRCDVSPQIGTGHLRRCITLARELKDYGAFICFACRHESFEIDNELRTIADEYVSLPWFITSESDAQEVVRLCNEYEISIVVIDHYHAETEYQKQLYEAGIKWLQFDGGFQNPLWAKWVINSSLAAHKCNYSNIREKDETVFLCGPKYALLRREFLDWRLKSIFSEQVQKILFTFGGGDDKGATVFCLNATKSIAPDIERVVLVSSANPGILHITNWVKQNNHVEVKLEVDSDEIARHMCEADLAIISGGVTAFETASMGLPNIIIQIAENQRRNADAWHEHGVSINMGRIEMLNQDYIKQRVDTLVHDVEMRRTMSNTGMEMVDCSGAERVAKILFSSN